MKRLTCCSIALLAAAAAAPAVHAEEVTVLPAMKMVWGQDAWAQSAGERATAAYTNINLATTNFARNFSTNTPGTSWIMGDDLQNLNLTGGSIIDEVTFSVVNGASTSAVGGGVAINVAANAILADVFFWDILASDFNPTAPNFETKPLLGSITVALPALNSLQGSNFTITGLAAQNINVGSGAVFAGVLFRDNPSVASDDSAAAFRYGQLLANQPATVGTSANFFFRDQINGAADALGQAFNAPIVSNFNWSISTIPAPGAVAAFGLAGLAAARRRRA